MNVKQYDLTSISVFITNKIKIQWHTLDRQRKHTAPYLADHLSIVQIMKEKVWTIIKRSKEIREHAPKKSEN